MPSVSNFARRPMFNKIGGMPTPIGMPRNMDMMRYQSDQTFLPAGL